MRTSIDAASKQEGRAIAAGLSGSPTLRAATQIVGILRSLPANQAHRALVIVREEVADLFISDGPLADPFEANGKGGAGA